jgi:hypothetical protein
MCHSTSIKNLHQCSIISSNNDDEDIRDLLSLLIDQVDTDTNTTNDTGLVLFNASSNSRRQRLSHRQSSDNDELLFQPADDYKHSTGILIHDGDLTARKNSSFLLLEFY